MHGEVRLLFAAAGLLKEEVSKCIGRVGDFVSVLLSCHEMEKNGGSIVWGGNVSRVLEWMGTGDSVVEICGIDFEGRLKEVGERVAGVLARVERLIGGIEGRVRAMGCFEGVEGEGRMRDAAVVGGLEDGGVVFVDWEGGEIRFEVSAGGGGATGGGDGRAAREEWRKKSGDERAAQSFRPRTSGDKLRCSNCAAHPAQLKAPGPGRPRTR